MHICTADILLGIFEIRNLFTQQPPLGTPKNGLFYWGQDQWYKRYWDINKWSGGPLRDREVVSEKGGLLNTGFTVYLMIIMTPAYII